MMNVEQLMEWELAGETEVVHHKYHITWHGLEPWTPLGEAGTNRMSYGTTWPEGKGTPVGKGAAGKDKHNTNQEQWA
jgi:hypothetical protein